MARFLVPAKDGTQYAVEAADKASAIEMVKAGKGTPVQQPPQSAMPPPSRMESMIRGGLQGASFGLGDEIAGAVTAPFTGMSYEQARDVSRERNALAQTANPGTYLAGELGGGLAMPGGIFASAARGAKILPTAVRALSVPARASIAGGGVGGLAGAGYSEADTAGGVAIDAAQGAGIGAVTAPLVPFAVRGAAAGAQGIGNAVANFGAGPVQKAYNAIANRLRTGGLTDPAQVRQALDTLGPEGRLMDLTPGTKNLAETLYKIPESPGAGIVEQSVRDRMAAQYGRMREATTDALKPLWDDYNGFITMLDRERKAQAAPLYAAAEAKGFQVTETLSKLFDKPSVKEAADRAIRSMQDEADSVFTGAQSNGTFSLKHMDQTIRELGDEIGAHVRAGRNDAARRLIGLKKALEKEIYAQVPEYQQARSVWAGSKQMEEAAKYGRDIFKGNKQADDIAADIADFSQAERDSMTAGVLRGVVEKLDSVDEGGNAIRKLVNSRRVRDIIRTVLPDEESAAKFLARVDAEGEMADTFNRVTSGSRTMGGTTQSDTLGNIADAAFMSQGLGSGNVASAIGTGARVIQRLLGKDMDPETATEAAKLLTSHLDDAKLAQMLNGRIGRGSNTLTNNRGTVDLVGRYTAGALAPQFADWSAENKPRINYLQPRQ